MKNYYEILEVNQKASKEIIEKAYKVLVKKYHPDVNAKKAQENNQKIKELNEAYEVLSNDFLREQYDNELKKEKSTLENVTFQKESSLNEEQTQKNVQNAKPHKIGSFMNLIEIVKELLRNKPKREQFKEVTKKDLFAMFLTAIILILLGIILWFIPFTNGWMREFLFENPLFNWIGRLFTR